MAGMFSPAPNGKFKVRVDNPGENFSPRVEIFITEDEFKDILGGMLTYAQTPINPKNKDWFESRDNTDDY